MHLLMTVRLPYRSKPSWFRKIGPYQHHMWSPRVLTVKYRFILECDEDSASSSPETNRCWTQVVPLMEPRNSGLREINDFKVRAQQIPTTLGSGREGAVQTLDYNSNYQETRARCIIPKVRGTEPECSNYCTSMVRMLFIKSVNGASSRT